MLRKKFFNFKKANSRNEVQQNFLGGMNVQRMDSLPGGAHRSSRGVGGT